MRKLSALLILLFSGTACLCQEKSEDTGKYIISVDAGGAICSRTMRLSFGRHITDHWSLEGGYAIDFSRTVRIWSQEEREHYNEFLSDSEERKASDTDLIEMDMKLKYWISETFKGGYIMAGVRHGIRQGTGCIAGAGYTFCIWKGLKCSLAYETGLGKLEDNGLRMILSYTY